MPIRRIFSPPLHPGAVTLDASESHHARDVLRLTEGATVELFDESGQVATVRVMALHPSLICDVTDIREGASDRLGVHVASAVPKGDRAEWMIEKLSELGVARFTPLRTARSVVHPEGKGKLDRWKRIAVEAAKQSRRAGLMRIEELTDVRSIAVERAAVLSTRDGAKPLGAIVRDMFSFDPPPSEGGARGGGESEAEKASTDGSPTHPTLPLKGGGLMLLVGPEGGWTEEELDAFRAKGVLEASLTDTILRIETAAVVASGIVRCALMEERE
ncbi:MAG: RsmE family RNA methyltransferase [Tepidisphaeraceae bacterium]